MAEGPPLVRTLGRGLDLLNCLSEAPEGLAVAELHRMVGLDMATIGRLLATLEHYGYVTQLPDERKFRVGPAGLKLGRQSLRQELLIAAAMPWMRRMRQETQETVGLFIRDGFSRICIKELTSQQPVRASTEIATEFPILSGGSGLVLVAFSPDPVREFLLANAPVEPRTPESLDDREAIRRQVELGREQGWLAAVNQHAMYLAGIAAPVLGPDGTALAAVAVTGPQSRWSEARRMEYVPRLIEQCAGIAGSMSKPKNGEKPKRGRSAGG